MQSPTLAALVMQLQASLHKFSAIKRGGMKKLETTNGATAPPLGRLTAPKGDKRKNKSPVRAKL